jgi:DNA-binding protein Fis
MAEIRKHYPATERKIEPELEHNKPKDNPPITEEINNNTVRLADEIIELIVKALSNNIYISYYLLQTKVFTAMKVKAIELCDGNVARAARSLGMKRTTFRESLRLKGLAPRIRRHHTRTRKTGNMIDSKLEAQGTRPADTAPRKPVWPFRE